MLILWNYIRKVENNIIYNDNNIYIGIHTKIFEEYFLNVILPSGTFYLNLIRWQRIDDTLAAYGESFV